MADQLLTGGKTGGKILIVKNPGSLPKGTSHVAAISSLSRQAEAVILFSHGDEKYQLPADHVMPLNVHHIRYAYETLQNDSSRLTQLLEGLGLVVRTRHLDATLPFLLTGSIISLPAGKSLDIYSGNDDTERGLVETDPDTPWKL